MAKTKLPLAVTAIIALVDTANARDIKSGTVGSIAYACSKVEDMTRVYELVRNNDVDAARKFFDDHHCKQLVPDQRACVSRIASLGIGVPR
jgi:hypothetical protein